MMKSPYYVIDSTNGTIIIYVSGGQKQFISFIRALIQNKSIILLDEPSSSLDETSKQILKDLIKKLEGKTILITTHDKELLSIFDTVIDNPAKKKKKESPNYKPYASDE